MKNTAIAIIVGCFLHIVLPAQPHATNRGCTLYNKETARAAIKSKQPIILLKGGIRPVITKADLAFAQKYHCTFKDLGCVMPPNNCIVLYNQYMFAYLDKKHGKAWRNQIRPDVPGLTTTTQSKEE